MPTVALWVAKSDKTAKSNNKVPENRRSKYIFSILVKEGQIYPWLLIWIPRYSGYFKLQQCLLERSADLSPSWLIPISVTATQRSTTFASCVWVACGFIYCSTGSTHGFNHSCSLFLFLGLRGLRYARGERERRSLEPREARARRKRKKKETAVVFWSFRFAADTCLIDGSAQFADTFAAKLLLCNVS